MEDKNIITKWQTKLSGWDYFSINTNIDSNDENDRKYRDYWADINLSIESLP